MGRVFAVSFRAFKVVLSSTLALFEANKLNLKLNKKLRKLELKEE